MPGNICMIMSQEIYVRIICQEIPISIKRQEIYVRKYLPAKKPLFEDVDTHGGLVFLAAGDHLSVFTVLHFGHIFHRYDHHHICRAYDHACYYSSS